MQEQPFFTPQVKVTDIFCQCWSKLTLQQRKRAYHKILLLVENHRHKSLKAHPLHRSPGKWGCSLSKTDRLVYSRQGENFILHAIGGHAVVDNAHRHSSHP